MKTKKNILFIYREASKYNVKYLLLAAKQMGHQVTLVHEKASLKGFEFIDHSLVTDLDNQKQAVEVILDFHRKHPVDGILHYEDVCQVLAARVAQALGLPFNSVDTAARVSDKFLMKQCFQEHNIPCAKIERIAGVEELKRIYIENGGPLVIKPVSSMGSIGVVKISNPDEAANVMAQARTDVTREDAAQDFVVEEYLDGPEVSVESIVYKGEIHHLAVTDKLTGAEPYFVEIGHTIPSRQPPGMQEDIKHLCTRGLKALGVRLGGAHSEVKITSRGLRIGEIHARLGGGMLPQLVRMATGIDMVGAAIKIALGDEPALKAKWSKAAGIRFLNPPCACAAFRIEGEKELGQVPGVCLFQKLDYRSSENLVYPPRSNRSRVGQFLVIGKDPQEVQTRADQALKMLTVVPIKQEQPLAKARAKE